nr:uncharacterized protein CI109_001596 [Kwoniella shandongensis]KAA5530190.1 hypothetical protein CI109_001596 [Kwoniella shandongensis]
MTSITSMTPSTTSFSTGSPLSGPAFQTHPRIVLRPSSNPSLSATRSTVATSSERIQAESGKEEEEDELQDDQLETESREQSVTRPAYGSIREAIMEPTVPPPVLPALPMAVSTSRSGSAHASSPRGGASTNASGGTGSGKSRKSSCELCHHRKIKCDQQRPSCFSCTRKGQVCRYAEEAEPSNHNRNTAGPTHQRAMSVTVVNASDPSIKYTMPVPGGATPALKVGYGHGNQPEWKVESTPANRMNGSSDTSAEKKKSNERRERIVTGFDSDSDDEAEGSVKGKGEKGKAKADVDGELAALVGDKPEEVDELEEDGVEQGDSVGSHESKKRGGSIDDDLSGELLELASAPPKKKKKASHPPSLTTTTLQIPQRPPPRTMQQRPTGRASLPNQAILPTPVSGITLPFASHTTRTDPYTSPLQNLAHSLPSQEMQTILFNTFFSDPFLTEGISLLQPQYMEDYKGLLERRATRLQPGDATTLANAFAFLAVALRILPDETSKLLLATQSFGSATNQLPRSLSRIITCQPAASSDTTPLDQRYFDLALLSAQIAEQADPPSVMLVMFKLILYRFCVLGHRRDKMVLAGMWLAQAVKVAQALGMGKEWEGLTQGERELRRRVMWSFETAFPYTIMDAHQGIHLPSPMAEAELYKLRPETRDLPPHATEVAPTSCTALFILTHLARRITPILDSFATISAANTPHDLVLRFDASLDAFQDALPPYFRLFPLTETRFDSTHPYLAAHRVRLHSTLLSYRTGVHRTHLTTYLMPTTPAGIRQVLAQVCLSSLRVQRSAKMLDPKVAFRLFNPITVFENAVTLALIMYVDKAMNAPLAPPPTIPGQGPPIVPLSPEYMNMRAGIAEALELLDTVAPNEGAGFARKAVGVVREIMVKVEAPLPLVNVEVDVKPTISEPSPTVAVPPVAPLTVHRSLSIDSVASPSPTSKPNSTMDVESARSAAASTSPSGSPRSPPVVNPHIQNVTNWLEGIRRSGVNMDIMLREAEWQGAWERIVASM